MIDAYVYTTPNGFKALIADIMNMTWPRGAKNYFGMDLSAYSHLSRWLDELEARPAFQRALAMAPPK
jgi:glutathione S-transferase